MVEYEGSTIMTVKDCIREIDHIKNAENILHDYAQGTMPNIAKQHINEIMDVLYRYMDFISEMKIQEN